MIRFTTAGESHGRAIVAILEGVPAGLPLAASDIDADLARRMLGHGRGARMKIESDRVQILSGVRSGETIGSPITLVVENQDYENWRAVMAVEASAEPPRRRFRRPRPGHADLVGTLKYDRRGVPAASSARTTGRVAAKAGSRRASHWWPATAKAPAERSDVTAVPAMAVIAEAMAALVLADAYAEKFGGDVDGYLAQLDARRAGWRDSE